MEVWLRRGAVLGEAEDLRRLADFLREVGRGDEGVRVAEFGVNADGSAGAAATRAGKIVIVGAAEIGEFIGSVSEITPLRTEPYDIGFGRITVSQDLTL